MSIFDANIQDEWSKDYLISKIKKAQEKYHKESPCVHCGPGNGCDDWQKKQLNEQMKPKKLG